MKKFLLSAVAGVALLTGAIPSASASQATSVQALSVINHPAMYISVGSTTYLKYIAQSSAYRFELISYGGTWSMGKYDGIVKNLSAGSCAVYAYDINGNLTDTFYLET